MIGAVWVIVLGGWGWLDNNLGGWGCLDVVGLVAVFSTTLFEFDVSFVCVIKGHDEARMIMSCSW